MVEQYKYDAFISYTHRETVTKRQSDKQIAHALHRFLESYQPPKEYKEQRISRVFIDTDELPTSSNLGAQITTELQQSRFLIIICSHEYQQSEYCKAELEYFLKIHNGSTLNVLVVLADGEPKDVFPAVLLPDADINQNPLLMRIEPLGADVRGLSMFKDKRKINREFLRIAAPIFGCGFDDLYRRHLRRKRQRIVLASILSLFFVAATFTYITVKNQQIAKEASQKHLNQAVMVSDKVQSILSNDGGASVDEQSALLLASTYIQQPELDDQPILKFSLASAVAQSALNANTKIFPRVLYLTYPYEDQRTTSSVFYYIAPSDTVLFADARDAKETVLYDAKTGAILRSLGHTSMIITKDAHYLFAYQNQYALDGTIARAVTLTDLFTLRDIITKPLDEITPDDDIITQGCGDSGPFAIYNGDTFLYAFKADGAEISQSEYESAFESPDNWKNASASPYEIVMPREEDVCYVTDLNGTVLLKLPKEIGYYSFSTDYSRMVYVLDNYVKVLDTSNWSEIASFLCPTSSTEKLLSTYILDANKNLISLMIEDTEAQEGSEQRFISVYDIANDSYLLKDEPGYRLDNQQGDRFYICSHGKLSAFTYHESNVRQASYILKMSVQNGTALVKNNESMQLIQLNNGTALLRWDPATQELVSTPDLNDILESGDSNKICLYGGKGDMEWAKDAEGKVDCIAISDDASTIAYASGSEIHLLNHQGADLDEYSLSFTPDYIAVSGNSVYAATRSEGVLIQDGTILALGSDLPFGEGQFIGNLLLMLDPLQSALNFVVCDLQGKIVYRPVNCVGYYQYAANTGWLAIQECSPSENPYPSLSMMRVSGTSIESAPSFDMGNQYDSFLFDQTGQYLTITGDTETTVYQLEQNNQILKIYGVAGIYQEGRMFARFATESGVFSQSLDLDDMLAYATQKLTSEHGLRAITTEEMLFP